MPTEVQLEPGRKSASEKSLVPMDEDIRREIPNLWLVREGETIRAPFQVYLEQAGIFFRMHRKDNPRRFNYCTRVPVLARQIGHKDIIEIKQGVQVDTFSKQRKIPEKLIPEVISRIKQYSESRLK